MYRVWECDIEKPEILVAECNTSEELDDCMLDLMAKDENFRHTYRYEKVD